LRASTTTALPFPVQVRMLVRLDRGTTRCCSPPRVPVLADGPAGNVLPQPHASPLSPPLWSVTRSFRSRGGLHGLTAPVPEETGMARVSGLPRFDRIAAAVLPMRSCQCLAAQRASTLPGQHRRVAEPFGLGALRNPTAYELTSSNPCSARPSPAARSTFTAVLVRCLSTRASFRLTQA
jgi:hypothetical protein